MNLTGTLWERKSDDVRIRIEGDCDAPGGLGNRSLRAVNLTTQKAFWVTPEGLGRKYRKVDES